MKLVMLVLLSLTSYATVVEVTPLENGRLFEDDNWGAIEYYAKRVEDNKYIWLGKDRRAKLFKSGEYIISGESVHNICYASSESIVIDVKKDDSLEVTLDIACE